MMKVLADALPEGFHVIGEGEVATVIYDVTPEDYGTWTGVVRDGDCLHLFPERSYRHKQLLVRLGLVGA